MAARRATGRPGEIRSRLLSGFDWRGTSGRGALFGALALLVLLWLLWRMRPAIPGWSRGWEALVLAVLGVAFVSALGHVLRRLNDAGLSGWFAPLAFVPWVNLPFLGYLLWVAADPRPGLAPAGRARDFGLALAVLVALATPSRVLWQPHVMTTEAMRPALLPGDLILAGRGARALPARGTVMAFRLPDREGLQIGRVIGLPGETWAMEEGRLTLDGTAAQVVPEGLDATPFAPEGPDGALPLCANGAVGLGAPCTRLRQTETLPDGTVTTTYSIGATALDRMAPVTLPPDHLLMLFDLRDAPGDSRIVPAAGGWGLVPLTALEGRVSRVLLSAAGAQLWQVWTWRPDRFLLGVP